MFHADSLQRIPMLSSTKKMTTPYEHIHSLLFLSTPYYLLFRYMLVAHMKCVTRRYIIKDQEYVSL